MSVTDFLDILIHIVFISLGVLAVVDYLRHRDETRRDVALMFSILAIPFLLQFIARIKGEEVSTGAQILSVTALVLEPYLLLRLVRYLRSMPVYMMRLAGYSLVGTVLTGILVGERVPLITTAVSQGYLIGFNLYAMAGFARAVRQSKGVQRQRLRFAAAGSGLFALIFVASLLSNAAPLSKDFALLLIETLAGACVIAYYIAFAPPRWLRQSWQLRELHNFLRQISGRATYDYRTTVNELSEAALRTVGGTTAVIATCDSEGAHLTIEIAGDPPLLIENMENLTDAVGQAWHEQKARIARLPGETGPEINRWGEQFDAHAVLIVPIISSLRPWGLLIVALRYAPLFAQDDLDLLTLFVEQSVISLDFSVLLTDTQRVGEERYHHVLDHMLEGGQIIGFDWRYLYVNNASARQGRQTRDNLIGRTMMEAYPGIETTKLFSVLERCMQERTADHMENEFVYPDGTRGWFELSIQPVLEGIFILSMDITERKHAEEELAYQAQILGNVNDAVIALDTNYSVTAWNTAAEKMYGWKAEEVLGRNGVDILQTQYLNAEPAEMRRRIAEAGEWRGEAYQRHKNGTTFPVEIASMVTHDENQRIKAYVSVIRDTTERKQAEEALRLSEERLKAIIEQSPLSIQFFSPDGICTGVNPAWEKLWGMQSEKIMGYNVLADPQIKEKGILPHLQKTFAGEVGSVPPTYYDPAEVGLVGEARWTTAVAYPVKDSSGQVREVVLTHQDVTERIQSEEKIRKLNEELEQRVNERTLALSEAHNLLQTLMDNMPDHIYFKDMKSRFIRNSRSQARMMGMNDPTEVIGKTDFDFFPPAHAQRSYDEEQGLIKSGQPIIDLEERVVWPNGRITWVSTTKLPWHDAEGEITGMFGISRDITERKQAEEELQNSNLQLDAANKELEAFSYSVSHDLRAPLRSIDGFSQALLEDYGNQIPEQGRQYLNRVRNAAQHMAELIDDLLNLSRVTRTPMKSETVDLSALAEKITKDLQHTEPERQATVSITPGLTAKGDAQLLYIVLMNLLGNAWKFTSKKEDPRIEFGTEADTDLTTFFVRDNGAGFDMTYADKLFGAFQRLHSMEEFPGTGIGLATVKRIISRHGGKVWAESESGTGTTFYFTL